MITCKRKKVILSGTLPEVLAELTAIISAVKDRTAEITDESFAREMIATAGRLAFSNEEELDRAGEEAAEQLRETIEKQVTRSEKRTQRVGTGTAKRRPSRDIHL